MSAAGSVLRHPLVKGSRRQIATQFARAVRSAPEGWLERLEGPLGRPLVEGVLRAMPGQLDRRRAAALDLAVEWRIGEPAHVRVLHVREGRARITAKGDADVALALSTPDFLRLAAGTANAAQLYMQGRITITGDLGKAMALMPAFRIPSAD